MWGAIHDIGFGQVYQWPSFMVFSCSSYHSLSFVIVSCQHVGKGPEKHSSVVPRKTDKWWQIHKGPTNGRLLATNPPEKHIDPSSTCSAMALFKVGR